MLLYKRRIKEANQRLGLAIAIDAFAFLYVILTGLGLAAAWAPLTLTVAIAGLAAPVWATVRYTHTMAWVARHLGPCPGCESRDGFLDRTKYYHTCCPYQQHTPGTCDCDP